MRALGRLLSAAAIAIVGILGLASLACGYVGPDPTGTTAECDGPPPPFAETVASAKQIVIGDVVAVRGGDDPAGRSSQFTIEVSHVVRGQVVARLDINDALLQPCAGNIVAGVGDRIALALNATAFTPAIPANGVAWIGGPAPEGLETTTIEDVYRIAGVPLPDTTGAAAAPASSEALPAPVVAAISGLVVALVFIVIAAVVRRGDPG